MNSKRTIQKIISISFVMGIVLIFGALDVRADYEYFSGNVGIGTMKPGYKLDVAGTTQITGSFGNPNAESAYRFKFYDNGGTYNDAGIGLDGSAGAEKMWFNTISGFYFNYGTAGQKIVFDSSGNIGIGSTTPAYKLDVTGTGSFTQPVIVGTPTATTHATTKSYVDSMFTGSGQWTTSGSNAYFSLAGNVGIGTTAPTTRLQIQGQASETAGTKLLGVYSNGSLGTGGSIFEAQTAGGVGLRVTEAGAFQMITPSVQFAGNGNTIVAFSGIGNSHQFTSSNTTQSVTDWTFNAGKNAGGNRTVGNLFAIANNDATKVVVDYAGNVGIGTTSSQGKLSVGGTGSFHVNQTQANYQSQVRVGWGDNWSGGNIFTDANIRLNIATGFYQYYNSGAGGNRYRSFNNNGTDRSGASIQLSGYGEVPTSKRVTFYKSAPIAHDTDFTTLTEMGSWQENGLYVVDSVGIGSTAPAYKLDVAGTSQFSQPVIVGTPTGTTHATTKSYVDSMFTGSGQWTTSGTNIYSSLAGNVGIGTTSPGAKLSVLSSTSSYGMLRVNYNSASEGEASMGFFGTNTSDTNDAWVIGAGGWSNTGDFVIGNENNGAGGNVRMLIEKAGNVGIGTTNLDNINTSATWQFGLGSNDRRVVVSSVASSSVINLETQVALNDPTKVGQKIGAIVFSTSQGQADAHKQIAGIVSRITGYDTYTYHSDLGFFTKDNGGPTEKMTINKSGNVGVGSTSPAYKLDVAGTGSFSQPVIVGTPTNTTHATTKSYVDSMFTGSGQWTTSGSNAYFSLAGNVGIGTTIPEAKLEINGAGYMAKFKSTTDHASILLDSAVDTDTNVGFFENNSRKWLIGNINSNDNFTFRNSSASSTVSITQVGNVGIGTTGPGAKLEIKDTKTHVSGDLVPDDATLRLYNDWQSDVGGKGVAITFEDNYYDGTYQKTTRAAIKGGTAQNGNSANGFLAFYTDSGSANTMPERARFDSSGNLGIGTITPGYKLDVQGTGSFTQPVIVGTPTATTHATTKSYVDTAIAGAPGSTVGYWTASGNNIYNSNTANVGINTTTPQERFHINDDTGKNDSDTAQTGTGNLIVQSSFGGRYAGTGAALSFALPANIDGSNIYDQARILATPDNNTNSNASGRMHLQTRYYTGTAWDWRNNLVLVSSGNVGIGTTAPLGKLHIGSTVGGEPTYRGDVIIDRTGITSSESTGGLEFKSDPWGSGYGWKITNIDPDSDGNLTSLRFAARRNNSTWSDAVTFTGAGNVGIGTTTPAYKLDVTGTGAFTQPVIVGTPTNTTHATTKSYVDSMFTGSGQWTTSGNNIYYALSGNVGIGTTSPQNKLQIIGSSGSYNILSVADVTTDVTVKKGGISSVDYNSSTYMNVLSWYVDNGNRQVTLGASTAAGGVSNNDIRMWTGGSERIRISSAGNVGVGETNPKSKLWVLGGATFTNDANEDYPSGFSFFPYAGQNRNLKFNQWALTRFDVSVVDSAGSPQSDSHVSFFGSGGGNLGVGTTGPSYKLDVAGTGQFTQPVIVGTPTNTTHAATKSYVDSIISGGYLPLAGGTLSGNLNMNGNNIVGVNKITAVVVDPLYEIDGKHYATYGLDIVGVKTEITGKATLAHNFQFPISNFQSIFNNQTLKYSYVIDLDDAERGSDLWMFWQTIKEGKNMGDIVVVLTPEFDGRVWYEVRPSEKQVVIYGSTNDQKLTTKNLAVSYRLIAPRHDADTWTTKRDIVEPPSFIMKSK